MDTVTIAKGVYEDLLDDQLLLNCLQAAGVDNWDGYDFAMEEYNAAQEESNDQRGEDD